jgi:multidrug efflux system membrane fusion protein
MRKLVWMGVFAVFAGAAAGWLLGGHPGGNARAAGRPGANGQSLAPAEAPAERGPAPIAVAPDAAARMGLEITALKPARHSAEFRTTAVVLSPQGLARLRAAYVAAEERLVVAQAGLLIARKEFQRQKLLYGENQVTSLKALEGARGALTSSHAQTAAATQQLQLAALSIEQQWGPVLEKWVVTGQPALEQILRQQKWLVQITLNAEAARFLPKTARLAAPSGSAVYARFLSSFPQTNPVIQGLNFLYVIPARPGFAPGLNLAAELPTGPARHGVVLPASAVVWSGGQAWAYKQVAPNRFVRVAVPNNAPTGDGWFVTAGFASGDRVVTQGAEELFSAETQPPSKGGGKED